MNKQLIGYGTLLLAVAAAAVAVWDYWHPSVVTKVTQVVPIEAALPGVAGTLVHGIQWLFVYAMSGGFLHFLGCLMILQAATRFTTIVSFVKKLTVNNAKKDD